jgi:conjugal transfer pilus assembly protein TraF
MEGFYWYDDPQAEAKEDQQQQTLITADNAQEELALLQQRFKASIALALLSPTKKNVEDYMILQGKIVNLSDTFSEVWQQVILENASLNGELENPTAQFAIEATKAMEYTNTEECLKRNRDQWLLIFVYDSSQKYSQLSGEMMESFQADTGWEIVPVSLDGNDLPGWSNSKLTKDQGATLGIEASPAYILVNKETEEIKHAGYGAIAVSRLKSNIYMQLGEKP